MREGDVIVAVGNTEVASVKEFDAVLAKVGQEQARSGAAPPRRTGRSYALIRPALRLSAGRGEAVWRRKPQTRSRVWGFLVNGASAVKKYFRASRHGCLNVCAH